MKKEKEEVTPPLVKEVTLKLRGKEVIAKFPNIGQLIKIEQHKQILSDGRYAIMAYAGMGTTTRMLDIIDAICYLSNVIPNFYEILGVGSYTDLLEMDLDSGIIVEITTEYNEKYQPLFNSLYERVDRPTVASEKE